MQVINHRLNGVEYIESPHRDDRPFREISLIVIHGISLPSGEFGGKEVIDLFTGELNTSSKGLDDLEGVRVSSHLFIRRDGKVVQFVDFDKRAWHAGVSSFHNREQCNDFSIGIELEGTDDLAYTVQQYYQLPRVSSLLMRHYGITEVVGHCHIAPGRKTDPGQAFDWTLFRSALAATL